MQKLLRRGGSRSAARLGCLRLKRRYGKVREIKRLSRGYIPISCEARARASLRFPRWKRLTSVFFIFLFCPCTWRGWLIEVQKASEISNELVFFHFLFLLTEASRQSQAWRCLWYLGCTCSNRRYLFKFYSRSSTSNIAPTGICLSSCIIFVCIMCVLLFFLVFNKDLGIFFPFNSQFLFSRLFFFFSLI